MKRYSRAKLLVSMINKENVHEDTIPSTVSHCNFSSDRLLKDSELNTVVTPFDNTSFVREQHKSTLPDSAITNETCLTKKRTIFPETTIDDTLVATPLSTCPETVFNDTFVTGQHTSFPETTINETFMDEPLSIFPDLLVFNNTFVTEQRAPLPETTKNKTIVAEPLSSSDELNTSEMILTDLDHSQEPNAPSVHFPRPQEESLIVHNSTITELVELNPCQINDSQVMPMTLDPIVHSEDQSLHIGVPHTVATPPLDHNMEAIQIPDTSSHGLSLNPETGLFEKDLRAKDTDDIQSNDISFIKNKRKHNQVLRVHGKEYDGLVNARGAMIQTKKPQRQLKPVPCNHGAVGVSDRSFLCGSVNEQGRKDIFYYFWSLSCWEVKKACVLGSVAVRQIIKRRKGTENNTSTKKTAGVDCYLPKEDGIKVRVCRDMFLATLDITKDSFSEWTKAKSCNTDGLTESALVISTHNSNQITEPNLKKFTSDSVIEWLDQLAKVPSHYCRSSTSRPYVDDALQSKTKMHEEYVSWCKLKSVGFVQRKRFCEILESKKISISKPRKDQCDTCLSFKEGNLGEEDYQAHLLKKDEARKAKKQTIASLSEVNLVFTMDLQSVQLCPKIQASSQYYKQKLQLHIFTIYVNNTKDVYLFAWHEGDGGVTANEFVTCIITFIELNATKGYKKMSAISDGCGYQNRNKVLSSALADVSRLQLIEIQQIILEKGHTMMEVDSVHSTLESCFTPPLYSPADYVTSMRKARPSQPYIIRHVYYKFFKNFEAISSNFASIRPGKKAGDPTVADIRSLLYRNGETFYKLKHDETEWTLLPQRRKADLYEVAQCLYTAPRKIEKTKFDSLQSLKPFMHRDYHSFYDNLSS